MQHVDSNTLVIFIVDDDESALKGFMQSIEKTVQ